MGETYLHSNQSCGMWQMGRMMVVYPGAVELVGVVMVKTPQGEYKRSVTRLCLLEEMNIIGDYC
jgi:hypothetical protein